MWDEDIVIPIAFFLTTIILALGIPLVRGLLRRWDRKSMQHSLPADATARLERIEQAIDAMSVEVERIAEGQRFVTRVLADRSPEHAALSQGGDSHNPGGRRAG